MNTRNGAKQIGFARITEAAEFLSMSRSKVYGLMDAGRLPFVRVDRCRRIRWSDLENFVSAAMPEA